ncbi:lipopolysaccharide-binding protein-like [Clavelina lepadiformis]|uniref:Lipid-binding serum glycoprotein C-terminal domain-containing protein n=1 Tax=Clavelina lepadiformis TaxID=159417 RepID=A0ABP0FHE9_CLALP
MKRGIFCLSVLLLSSVWLCLANQSGEEPGIKLRVHSRGLDFVRQLVLQYLDSFLNSYMVPNLSGFGTVNYEIQNIEIESFDIGETSFKTFPPNIFRPVINGASTSLRAKWKVWKKVLFVTLRLSGELKAGASGLNIGQSIELGRNDMGKPTFKAVDCSTFVKSLKFDVKYTGLDWLINLGLSLFETSIKDKLQSAVCGQIKKVLDEGGEGLTDAFKVNLPLISQSSINVGLVCDPEATSMGVMFSLRGRCFPNSSPDTKVPIKVSSVTTLDETAEMIRFSVNEYVLNTLLYSLWFNDILTWNVSSSQVRDAVGFEVTSDTLAPLDPTFEQYAGRPIEFKIEAPNAPSALFGARGLILSGDIVVVIYVVQEDGSRTRAESLDLSFNATGMVMINQNSLKGNISDLRINADAFQGTIAELFNEVIGQVIPTNLLPAVNGILNSGYMFPESFGFTVENPTLAYKQGALEVGADIRQVTQGGFPTLDTATIPDVPK